LFIIEAGKETALRLRLQKAVFPHIMERLTVRWFGTLWRLLFREDAPDFKEKNSNVFISINRIIYDLPFFGLIFMGLIFSAVFFLLKLGDNPSTPQIDGHIVNMISRLSSVLLPLGKLPFFLVMVVLVCIFLTELVSNTTVVLVTFPLIIKIAGIIQINPLHQLLAIAVASNGAFMTPIATSVNAVAFASVPGVSLKKMLKLGFIMNILCGLWISGVFYVLRLLF
jgi:sodium-dependent dicarboxylate transporter 2/3/5